MPSTPTATAWSTAAAACACAVTGRPAACDCSTSSVAPRWRTGDEYVGPSGHHAAAGHHLYHINMSLRPLPHGSHDFARAAHLTAEEAAMPARDGDRWTGGNDPGQPVVNLPLRVSPLHHVEVPVAEVADCRHTSGQLPSQRLGDYGLDLLRGVPRG